MLCEVDFFRILFIRIYRVVMPRMLPSTRVTAQSCHHGASGAAAEGRGQAMLTSSNTDQIKAAVLISNPQTPSFNSPNAGFQRPVSRVNKPTPVVMENMA